MSMHILKKKIYNKVLKLLKNQDCSNIILYVYEDCVIEK